MSMIPATDANRYATGGILEQINREVDEINDAEPVWFDAIGSPHDVEIQEFMDRLYEIQDIEKWIKLPGSGPVREAITYRTTRRGTKTHITHLEERIRLYFYTDADGQEWVRLH